MDIYFITAYTSEAIGLQLYKAEIQVPIGKKIKRFCSEKLYVTVHLLTC